MVAPDLQVLDLVKSYGGFRAVDRISFSIPQGRFFSILGPSGCGKTTLLRLIAGFLSPDAGDIRLRGDSVLALPPNRRPVNMVFQHLALFPMMDVQANVGYGLARRGTPAADIRRRVDRVLERVGLAGSQRKTVDQLSGGQKQRVAMARCLVLEPTLLLLDEPLGALDLHLRERMKVELKQLQAEFGTTFVYITHDQSEALVLSDQVAVMNHGRFEQVGSPMQLYHQPATAFVAGFVGHANRLAGRVVERQGGRVRIEVDTGWCLWATPPDLLPSGAAVQAFLRPEMLWLARPGDAWDHAQQPRFDVQVSSVLFDGAASSVLVKLEGVEQTLRVALPQTGAWSGIAVGDRLVCGYDPGQVNCFSGPAP